MNENLLVKVGDLHMRPDFPMFNAKLDFLNWLFDQEDLNNPNNTLLFTGDLGDAPRMEGEVNSATVSLFEKRNRFKLIIMITGNHDMKRGQGSFLHNFSHLPFVHIVEEIEEIDVDGLKILCMPHFIVKNRSEKTMRELYGNLPKYRPEFCEKEYDIISGHFHDETQPGGIDTTALRGRRLHGHEHHPSLNYIGTPVINRKDEKGKDNHIAITGCQSKDMAFREVPCFLDYYDIPYAPDESLPEMPTPYKMITVDGAPSETAALELIQNIPGAHLHTFHKAKEEEVFEESDLSKFQRDKNEFVWTAIGDYITENKITRLAVDILQGAFERKRNRISSPAPEGETVALRLQE